MKSSLQPKLTLILRRICNFYRKWAHRTRLLLEANVYFGKYVDRVPNRSLIFFPCRQTILCCGIAGIVAFKNKQTKPSILDLESLENSARKIETNGYQSCEQTNGWDDCYLGGREKIDVLWRGVQAIKTDAQFFSVFSDENAQNQLRRLANRLGAIIETETGMLAEQMGHLSAERVDLISHRIEKLKDIKWSLDTDILSNTKK